MSSSQFTTLPSLTHERRPPSQAPRVWAGSVMLVSSVFLVFLGGCFLMGVYGLVESSRSKGPGFVEPLTQDALILMYTLYVLGGVSILGALILFILGVRGLWRVLRMVEDVQEP
jgi:hypothetical protein